MTDLKISQFTDGNTIQTTDEIATNRGGVNTKVFVGTGATLDAGTDIGDLVVLQDDGSGNAQYPAGNGALLSDVEPADDSVSTIKIQNDAVTTAKILNANVTTAKIADANVTTVKILDANVTTAKIADNAVTLAKIVQLGAKKLWGNITGSSANAVEHGFDYGTYTPTLTGLTNVASSTPVQCQYLRVGNFVIVSGSVTIDPTATGDTVLSVSLPIASSFALAANCGGSFSQNSATVAQFGNIAANTGNGTATFRYVATNTGAANFWFTFSYLVI